MGEKSVIIGLVVVVLSAIGGLVVYDMKYGHKLGKLFGNDSRPNQNWRWQDSWDAKNQRVEVTPVDRIQPPVTSQIVAGNYDEAIAKSGELGKPVLVFFTADWCGWCKKMKSETMTNANVQTMLRNYILVYVDTDKDRVTARKFGAEGLPSYAITNGKGEKLKFESGFKTAATFTNWLNSPELFTQPRIPQIQPSPKNNRPSNPNG